MTVKARVIVQLKGGAGSGHHGHAGRVGKRGGSVPGSGGVSNISVEQAEDMWTDNYYSNKIKAASQGKDISKMTFSGGTENDWNDEEVTVAAKLLQERASSTQLSVKTVYRGDVRYSEEEALEEFAVGATVRLSGLTAASRSESIAGLYTDVETIGGEGIGIVFTYHNPRGIMGTNILSADQEMLLPHGASYKVRSARIVEDEYGDRLFNVQLISDT